MQGRIYKMYTPPKVYVPIYRKGDEYVQSVIYLIGFSAIAVVLFLGLKATAM